MTSVGVAEYRSILLRIYIGQGLSRDDAQERVNDMLPRALRDNTRTEIRKVLLNKLVDSGKKYPQAEQLVRVLSDRRLFEIYLKLPQGTPVTYYPDAGEKKQQFNSVPVLIHKVATGQSMKHSEVDR